MLRIVNIIGGLGNQMFQYAFAIAVRSEFAEDEIKINTLCFNGYPLHNGFELYSIFPNHQISKATSYDLFKVAWPWVHYRLWQLGNRILPVRKGMTRDTDYKKDFTFQSIQNKTYFDGYWQSPKFFEKHKETIKHIFRFSPIIQSDVQNYNAVKFIENDKTAFIHIRRGDYLNHPIFGGICSLEYYKKGIKKLRDGYKYSNFIVFSNDILWCKENLKDELCSCNVLYADWNKGKTSFRDMQLMSLCKAGLIANSSFSWWGAWLGDMEIVISPSKWTNIPEFMTDIIPSYWEKI